MNPRISQIALMCGLSAVCLGALPLFAEEPAAGESDAAASAPPAPPPANPAPPLSYEAEDVLKLSRAQVGDDVTLNYLQNSQTTHNLSAEELSYLKSEGVSDQVLKAMTAPQNSAVPDTGTAATADQAQPGPAAAPDAPSYPNATAIPLYAPIYVAPAPAPTPPAPASTLYVIPYPAAGTTVQCYPAPRVYGSGSTVITINRGYGGGSRVYHSSYGGRHRRH